MTIQDLIPLVHDPVSDTNSDVSPIVTIVKERPPNYART